MSNNNYNYYNSYYDININISMNDNNNNRNCNNRNTNKPLIVTNVIRRFSAWNDISSAAPLKLTSKRLQIIFFVNLSKAFEQIKKTNIFSPTKNKYRGLELISMLGTYLF